MKASLVSATSLGALLAFQAMPAQAQGPVFTLNQSLNFGNSLVNCAAITGCTVSTLTDTATLTVSSTNATTLTFGSASSPFSGTTHAQNLSPVVSGTTKSSNAYTFTATTRGAASQTLNVSATQSLNNKSLRTQTTPVTLVGTGVAPVQSTTSGNNGYVLVGTSNTATINVNNTGNGNTASNATTSATITNLNGSISSANGTGFSGPASGSSFSLHDTSSTNYTYTFAPGTKGATATSVVTVTFSDGNSAGTNTSQSASFTLAGTGVAPVATIAGANAGYVLAGQTKSVLVTVQNTGNGNLSGLGTVSNLQGTVLGATSSGLFTGTNTSLTNSVNGTGLQDSGSQSVAYVFTPTTMGTFSANVTGTFTNGTSNTNAGNNLTATLTGTGVAPVSSVSVSNPGYVLVKSAANTGSAVVTVYNTGNGALSGLGSVSNLQGTQGASSSVFTGSGGSINLQDTHATTGNGFATNGSTTATFTYNFAPTASGAATSVVTSTFTNSQGANGNYATGTTTVTLTGTGVAPINSVTLTNAAGVGGATNTGNLGYLLVGSQAATATVALSNVGNGDLAGKIVNGGQTVTNLNGSITASSGSGFSGSTSPTSVSLQDSHATTGGGFATAGATTSSFNYTFAPTARGAATTIVTSSFSNGSTDGLNNAATVTNTITGTGVAPLATMTGSNNGYVLVKQSNTATVSVQNTGNGNLADTGGAFNLNGSVTAATGTGFSGGGTPSTISLLDSNAGTGATTSSYSYTFAPTARGTATTVVTGSFSNGIGNNNTSGSEAVTLTATGVAPISSVSISNTASAGGTAGTGNLGYLLVNSQTGTATVTLSNSGNGDLASKLVSGGQTVNNLNGSITASAGTGFSGSGTPTSVSLQDSNATTGNGFASNGATTSSFNYTFAPTARGVATTVVTSNFSNGSTNGLNNAATVTNTITGTGVAPIESVSGGSALSRINNYGYAVNAQTGTAAVTVQNVGNGNLSGLGSISNLNASSVGGPTGSAAFTGSGSNASSLSLTDSGTSTLSYLYSPVSRGTSSATVSISFSNGNSAGNNLSQTVSSTITGQGVGPTYASTTYWKTSNGTTPLAGTSTVISTPPINGGTATASTINYGSLTYRANMTLLLNISNITADFNNGNNALTDLTLVSASFSGGTDASAFSLGPYTSIIHEGGSIYLPIMVTANQYGTIDSYLTLTTDENAPLGDAGDLFTYALTASVVPEPASLVLLGAGLAGLGFARRRKFRDGRADR